MENQNIGISQNVQNQTFILEMKASDLVKKELVDDLKRKRRNCDRKINSGMIKKKKFSTLDLDKKKANWQNFMVIILSIFLLYKCNKVHK